MTFLQHRVSQNRRDVSGPFPSCMVQGADSIVAIAASIFRWPLHAINHQHFDRPSGCFEFKTITPEGEGIAMSC